MKDFLLIANHNAITYKEFFPLLKVKKVKMGYAYPRDFDVPEGQEKKQIHTDWFTTLPVNSGKKLVLTKSYNEKDYPRYDNYDAIEVGRVKDIPIDYDGVMGVPITILEYNLDDVEILGVSHDCRDEETFNIKGAPTYIDEKHKNFQGMVADGRPKYARILIRRKQL